MNVTFIVGNGFDLQLGMKTGYGDFLKWYVEQPTNDMEIKNFRLHLKDEKGQWWSDAEIAMGQYLGNFTDDNISVYFKNIRDFKIELGKYLTIQNEKYDLENDPNTIEVFKDFLLRSADDIMLRSGSLRFNARREQADTYIQFVSFNYTNALDRLCSKITERSKVLETVSTAGSGVRTVVGDVYHVHGRLDTSIVMGVDNPKQLDTKGITNFKKLNRTVIKPNVNEEMGGNEHQLAASAIKRSEYIFLYGLSFGKTDETWWNLIANRLAEDKTCQVVIFTRSNDKNMNPIVPEDTLDFVDDKKDDFLSKIGITPSSEYYDAVRKKVFVIRNTERLNISIENKKVHAGV